VLNGDISNETPPRIIVTVDLVVDSELVESKRLLRGANVSRTVKSLNNAYLSHLWNKAFQYGIAVELAAFEDELWTQEQVDKLMARLDNRGGNPFNYAELYASIHDLVGELPYRTNLKGVIDINERILRYGSWGMSITDL
jgi:post-segregation antitoxin (ccd killing protein)